MEEFEKANVKSMIKVEVEDVENSDDDGATVLLETGDSAESRFKDLYGDPGLFTTDDFDDLFGEMNVKSEGDSDSAPPSPVPAQRSPAVDIDKKVLTVLSEKRYLEEKLRTVEDERIRADSKYQTEITGLTSKLTTFEIGLKLANCEIRKVTNDNVSLQVKVEALETLNREYNDRLASLRKAFEMSRTECQALKEKQRLSVRNDTAEDSLLRTRLVVLEKFGRHQDTVLTKAKTDLETAQREILEMESKLKEQRTKQNEKNSSLQQQLRDSCQDLIKVNFQLENALKEKSQLAHNIDRLKGENVLLLQSCKTLEEKYTMEKRTRDAMQNELDKAALEKSKLEQYVKSLGEKIATLESLVKHSKSKASTNESSKMELRRRIQPKRLHSMEKTSKRSSSCSQPKRKQTETTPHRNKRSVPVKQPDASCAPGTTAAHGIKPGSSADDIRCICGAKFKNVRYRKKHIQERLQGRIFSCDICPKSFPRRCALRRHEKTHVYYLKK